MQVCARPPFFYRSLSASCRPLYHQRSPASSHRISFRYASTDASSHPSVTPPKAEETITTLQKGKIIERNVLELIDSFKGFKAVHFDLGSGDCKYVYREAKKKVDTLFVAVDCNPACMVNMSAKVGKKPAKGGINNALFVVSAVENLPLSLREVAHSISINYPWGRLLKDLVQPDITTLFRISNLGRIHAPLDIRLNMTVFSDHKLMSKLGLPQVDENYIQNTLIPSYISSAIKVNKFVIGKQIVDCTWGKHLSIASGRETLHLQCKIMEPKKSKHY